MTQEEEKRYMQSLTNEELIACLRWYGHDPYYNEDYEYTIKEIERRLKGKMGRKIIQEIEKTLNEYLTKCIENNHHCAHCIYNHEGTCYFAAECFANDQKYYQDEE